MGNIQYEQYTVWAIYSMDHIVYRVSYRTFFLRGGNVYACKGCMRVCAPAMLYKYLPPLPPYETLLYGTLCNKSGGGALE